jgi:AcrR family transcriptional regulator
VVERDASHSSPDEARRPGRPRDARADVAILNATFFELAENGYAGLSMDKVAARAGVSKATIYRRWPSREALILDAWRAVDPAEHSKPDTGDIRTDLELLCAEYERSFSGEIVSMLPQMVAAVQQSPQLAELFTHFVDEHMRPLYDVYQRALERGQLRPDVDVKLAATLLAGPIFFSLLFRREILPAPDLRATIDYVLKGLLAEAS